MSDSHSPYGGQPDPNAAPWGTPPGSPVGPPPMPSGSPAGYPMPPGSPTSGPGAPGYPTSGPGAPGYPTSGSGAPGYPSSPYGAPTPPPPPPYAVQPQKSGGNRGVWLGLGIGAAVMAVLVACGSTIGYFVLGDDDEPSQVATSGSPSPGGDTEGGEGPEPSPTPAEPDNDGGNGNNNAVTARNSSDFNAVCDGNPVLNAAPYTSAKGAKVYTFANNPDRPGSWLSKSVGFNKPYYARTSDWATVSVVGCLTFVQGSEGEPRKCQYKDRDDKQVTVDYISSRYTLTFHNAQTGEKLGDGGRINAPAGRCPSFISYNRETLKSYAQPDNGAIELALDKFTS
ncbi:hypothetical protein [Micromonospora sp. NPDC003241]